MTQLTANVSVCFSALTKMQALTLKRELADVDYFLEDDALEQSSSPNPVPIYSATLTLRFELIDDVMSFYIKQQLTIEQCHIQIILPTQREDTQAAFSVPPIVNHMLTHLNCGLVVVAK